MRRSVLGAVYQMVLSHPTRCWFYPEVGTTPNCCATCSWVPYSLQYVPLSNLLNPNSPQDLHLCHFASCIETKGRVHFISASRLSQTSAPICPSDGAPLYLPTHAPGKSSQVTQKQSARSQATKPEAISKDADGNTINNVRFMALLLALYSPPEVEQESRKLPQNPSVTWMLAAVSAGGTSMDRFSEEIRSGLGRLRTGPACDEKGSLTVDGQSPRGFKSDWKFQ